VGAGHNQAAKAVENEIVRRFPRARVNIVDFMAGENSKLNTLLKETYLKLIAFTPTIYDLLYRWTKNQRRSSRAQTLLARATKRAMLSLYRQYRPDIIICTHPFPCGAAAHLRSRKAIGAQLAAVVTDFVVHPLWISPEVDFYFVAGQEVGRELRSRGIPAGRIYPTGIPIDASFNQNIDRSKVLANYGLDPDQPIILVMAGGLGVGPVRQVVQSLSLCRTPIQTVVITGKNAELRRELRLEAARLEHKIIIVGYTRHVRELMAIADLLITKPGGLTTSEALSLSLPMVLFSPIAGQEEDNAVFLTKQKTAVLAKDLSNLNKIVADLLNNRHKIAEMKWSAHQLGHPEAAQAIVNVLGRYICLNELPEPVVAAGRKWARY
jgi:processive 1,2-diacylglycerol beta-glucosyltransferase